MAAYCLPKEFASKFLNALKGGQIDPAKLTDMSSAQRRKFFEGIVGEEHAPEVNALFESKLLLKDQKAGLVRWAQKVGGISEPARKDIIAKIGKLDRVLQPADEKSFLADLASRKLGVTVSADEAKQIFDLSQKVEAARQAMAGGWTPELGRQYGLAYQDLVETIDGMKPSPSGWLHTAAEVLNIPRSLLTLGHGSAPFVQNWGLISTKQWYQGFPQMWKDFSSEQGFRDMMADIIGHPDYELSQKAGLSLTKLGDKLTQREESIQTTLVEKANEWLKEKGVVPFNLARASSRGFTGYMNFVRFETFKNFASAARLAGEDVSVGSKAAQDIAKMVNNFSGRGSLGRFESSETSALLNAFFFAPRKMVGTMQMFNPANMLLPSISKTARMGAFRLLGGSILATATALGIARAMGADVDIRPISANFAKIQIGDTKFDLTGGNDTYARLLARLWPKFLGGADGIINAKGDYIPYGPRLNRATEIGRFLRGKLAPVAGAITDAFYGSDPVGRPFSVTREMQDKLMPISLQGPIDVGENDPQNWSAFMLSLSSFVGVGVQGPQTMQGRGKNNRDPWGETTPTPETDPINQTLERVGMKATFPPKKIRGIALNDDQYDEYQQIYGRMSKMAVANLTRTKGFANLPVGTQEELIRKALSSADPNNPGAHEMAARRMMMKYPAIVVQAAKLKQMQKSLGTKAANAAMQAP